MIFGLLDGPGRLPDGTVHGQNYAQLRGGDFFLKFWPQNLKIRPREYHHRCSRPRLTVDF